jgi:hypothetical protein
VKILSQIEAIKKSINDEEKKIDLLFTAIGKVCFEKYGKVIKDKKLQSLISNVRKSLDEIENYKEEIRLINAPPGEAEGICSECGTPYLKDASFCICCRKRISRIESSDPSVQPEQPNPSVPQVSTVQSTPPGPSVSPTQSVTPIPPKNFCPACGDRLLDGFNFCISCGKKIEEL